MCEMRRARDGGTDQRKHMPRELSSFGPLERRDERDDLETDDEQDLTDEVDERGVYRERVHVGVKIALPEELRERAGEEKGCHDLDGAE